MPSRKELTVHPEPSHSSSVNINKDMSVALHPRDAPPRLLSSSLDGSQEDAGDAGGSLVATAPQKHVESAESSDKTSSTLSEVSSTLSAASRSPPMRQEHAQNTGNTLVRHHPSATEPTTPGLNPHVNDPMRTFSSACDIGIFLVLIVSGWGPRLNTVCGFTGHIKAWCGSTLGQATAICLCCYW